MNPWIFLQARMASERMPGKVLMSLHGKPMLQWCIEACEKTGIQTVVLTTDKAEDGAIQLFCERCNLIFYRGASEDVLKRFFESAEVLKANPVLRLSGDCPLIQPYLIDACLHWWEKDSLSGVDIKAYPDGFDCQCFGFELLKEAHEKAFLDYDREHVTHWMESNLHYTKIRTISTNEPWPKVKLSVDTKEDFERVEGVIKNLGTDLIASKLEEYFYSEAEVK